jgi:hypothetical protein
MSPMQDTYVVFDVEAIGFHGDGYAVGAVVIRNGLEVDSMRAACPIQNAHGPFSGFEWVRINAPALEVTCQTPREVRQEFWSFWSKYRIKSGAKLVADCGWPVEARFLLQCIDDSPDREGPYPFHELASFLVAAGMDPLATYDRFGRELPKHCPLADSRQSARLLVEALGILAAAQGAK